VRRFKLLLLATVSALVLASCGGGYSGALPTKSSGVVLQPTNGNWVLDGSSAVSPTNLLHLSGAFYVRGSAPGAPTVLFVDLLPLSPCLPAMFPDILSSVSATTNVITIHAVFGDTTLDASLTGSSSTLLIGTYTVTGGCANGDHGTLTATYVPPVDGSWTGPITTLSGTPTGAQMTLNLTQSSSEFLGFFPLGGTAQITGSTCLGTATVGSGIPEPLSPLMPGPAPLPSAINGSSLAVYLTSGSNTAVLVGGLDAPNYNKTMHALISSSSCAELTGMAVLVKQ